MNRDELLEKAANDTKALLAKYPENPAIKSILSQIYYLIGLNSGTSYDRSRLKDITIGILAAREVEPLDMTVAETLYAVAAEANWM